MTGAAALSCLLAALSVSAAGAAGSGGHSGGGAFPLPSDCTMSFGSAGPAGDGRMKLSGYVDIQCGTSRIQADTVVYDPKTKLGTAEGTVVLDWGPSRVVGNKLDFDLGTRTGTMTEASGWLDTGIIMSGKTIQKLDDEHVLLIDGRFTTCTQPTPYWSFRVGRGLFKLGKTAYLHNVRLNAGTVPVFWIPWLSWPISGDRTRGFLLPQWGVSRTYGFYAGTAYFLPITPSADVTLYGDYYWNGGPAGGLDANWLPNATGRIRLSGYFLHDVERQTNRWAGRLQAGQRFGPRWRFGAELNQVSDFLYYEDFSRNLTSAAATATVSAMRLEWNGDFTSFNAVARHREQYFPQGDYPYTYLQEQVDLDALPSLELRGRSRRLPGTPLYFSWDASTGWFRRDDQSYGYAGQTLSRDLTNWGRLDLSTGIAMPVHFAPWLSFEPRGIFRETYYTAQRDPTTGRYVEGQPLGRTYYELQGQLIGPSVYRVFQSSSLFSTRWKSVIEPRLLYRYVPLITDQEYVPIYDERDVAAQQLDMTTPAQYTDSRVASDPACRDLSIPGGPSSQAHSCVTVTLRTRLVAKRPPQITELGPRPLEGSTTAGALPWSSFPAPVVTPAPASLAPVSPEPKTPADESSDAGDGTAGAAQQPSQAATGSAIQAAAQPATGTTPVSSKRAVAVTADTNPVEIASFEIGQSYSLTNPLSARFVDREICPAGGPPPCVGGVGTTTTRVADGIYQYGPISLTLHLNPTFFLSVDLRSEYDLVNNSLTSNALSGWYRWNAGYVNATWYRDSPVGTVNQLSSQLRLAAGVGLLNHKLTLDGDLGYDLLQSKKLDRRGRVGYYTQCCGFVVEYLDRNFEGNQRSEIRFVLDLKGVGKLLDLGGIGAP